jgi:phosphotriesterase-related protein
VAIVLGTGFYIEELAGPLIGTNGVESLAAAMIADIEQGIDGTGIRAGIIGEIGVSDPWSAAEQRVMQAAVLAQQATGATINVHPGRRPESPLEVARMVGRSGGDVGRLIISHLDRTFFTEDEALGLLDTGCIAEWDFFGIESSYYPFAPIDLPTDGQRLNLIRRLIDRGHGPRITISQDICTRTRLRRWGGYGYAHMLDNVVPMMRRKGFGEDEIAMLLVETPRRLLALGGGSSRDALQ